MRPGFPHSGHRLSWQLTPALCAASPCCSKDAIDLETAGSLSNLVLLSLFRAGHSDSGYNSDVQVEAPSPLPNWDWMQMPDGYDSSDAAYSMVWTEDAITWTVNGNLAAKYTPKDGAQWLTSNVPIRLGLWATDPSQDWAGQLDWDANPKAEATFTSLTLSWCVSPCFADGPH